MSTCKFCDNKACGDGLWDCSDKAAVRPSDADECSAFARNTVASVEELNGITIWGGIVNTSRTLGAFTQTMIVNQNGSENIDKELLQKEIKSITYRHIAYM